MVDLNEDGIPDVSQINDHFKVLNATDGSGPIALETANPNNIIDRIESVEPDTYPDKGEDPKPEDVLFGMLTFRLRLQIAGDTTTVVVYFYEALPDEYKWYKYDPAEGWCIFAGANFSDDRRSLTFTIQDGGDGDADRLVNGIIVDPAGAGANQANGSIPSHGSAGISGSGGVCFVTATVDEPDFNGLSLSGTGFLLLWLVFFLLDLTYLRRSLKC
jgi:hypothetical protein